MNKTIAGVAKVIDSFITTNSFNAMKIKFLLGVVAVAAIGSLNSCKDDEVPVAGVNF